MLSAAPNIQKVFSEGYNYRKVQLSCKSGRVACGGGEFFVNRLGGGLLNAHTKVMYGTKAPSGPVSQKTHHMAPDRHSGIRSYWPGSKRCLSLCSAGVHGFRGMRMFNLQQG